MPHPPDAAVIATREARIAELAQEYWELSMARWPTYATYLGDRRYDDRLSDLSPAARERHLVALDRIAAGVNEVPGDGLSATVRITREMMLDEIADAHRDEVCRFERWTVDPLNGPQVTLAELPNFHTADTADRAATLIARYRAIGPYFEQHIANLREGLAAGLVAARLPVERVIKQMDEMLAGAPEKSAFVVPAAKFAGDHAALVAAVRESVWPALRAYRDVLAKEILPRTRTGADIGVSKIPGGPACYAAAIKLNTGAEHDPTEVHALGLRELERIHAEMNALSKKLGGGSDWAAFAAKAKTTEVFKTRDEVYEAARAALARAIEAVPAAFGKLPSTPCEVKRMEAFREKDAVAAYYYSSDAEATRPGVYYVNTYAPETRPKFNAEVLAFHESIPGHHLQIALANELRDLPKFRRHGTNNAYVEGWALYTERLADELGLYSSDLSRFGMLSYDAWRASRLVVDTGLHHLGWTRERAIEFMLANTALTRAEVENEVDRYVVWPGQALGYKLGQLEILRLRALAKKGLGARFDLKAFHDQILNEGAVPLGVLAKRLEAWAEGRVL